MFGSSSLHIRSLRGAALTAWLLPAAGCHDDVQAGDGSASSSGTGVIDATTSADATTSTGIASTSGSSTSFSSGLDESSTGIAPIDPPVVHITEIMYHPVLEQDFLDHHEFVELHNPGTDPVSLDGWTLANGIDFALPPGTVLAPGGYLVIAKDPQALLAVAEYGLTDDLVVGPFDGKLDNGDDTIELRRDDTSLADSVRYEDDFPWPVAADAFGASDDWLAPELLPLEDHRHRGVSLERLSELVPADEISNWVPSAVDDASPGRAFAAPNDDPPPVLLTKHASTASADPLIRAGEEVVLDLDFSTYGALSNVRIDYFVDDVQVQGEPVLSIDVPDTDFTERAVAVHLPGQPDESIVRWRVFGDRGNGVEQISPRPSDPYQYHAYFVSPVVDSNTRLYQLYIATDDWTQLWTNIQAGREIGCEASPTWDDRVPAVFVYEGEVHDVRVRYQGSRWNRGNGPTINNWPHPGPTSPSPLRGLSYSIAFPSYHRFEGRQTVMLNKLTQGCPGLAPAVGFELFRRMGIPAPFTRYIRFHINGGYYRYMMEIEHPDEAMMAAWHQTTAADPTNIEPVGHLFKSVGLNNDAGPYGWGDGRVINDYCGHDAYTRYGYTYDRKTHSWAGHDDLITMMETLDGYRNHADGSIDVAATQAYLEQNFDVDMVLDHIVVMNFGVPFDDYFQNHYLYQRRSDDAWFLMPWDLDQNFGPWAYTEGAGAQSSIFGGRNGQDAMGGINANRNGWWNRIKDSFLRTYEAEFITRMKAEAELTLHPDAVGLIVDSVVAQYDVAEANAAASPPSCNVATAATSFNAFVQARHDYIVNTPDDQLTNW